MADIAERRELSRWPWRVLELGKAMLPTVLIFLVVGPLAGYFAFMLPLALTAIGEPHGVLLGLLGMLTMLPFGGLFAYALGWMPALATGLVIATIDCVADLDEFRTPAAIATGAAITVALLLAAVGLEEPVMFHGYAGAAAIAGSVGAIAAGMCAMIARRRVPN